MNTGSNSQTKNHLKIIRNRIDCVLNMMNEASASKDNEKYLAKRKKALTLEKIRLFDEEKELLELIN